MTQNKTRISNVTTRSGDAGQTRLGNNVKVSKASPAIRALGSVDELNSAVGLLRCHLAAVELDLVLAEQQQLLFDIGAVVAMAGDYATLVQHRLVELRLIGAHNRNARGAVRRWIALRDGEARERPMHDRSAPTSEPS